MTKGIIFKQIDSLNEYCRKNKIRREDLLSCTPLPLRKEKRTPEDMAFSLCLTFERDNGKSKKDEYVTKDVIQFKAFSSPDEMKEKTEGNPVEVLNLEMADGSVYFWTCWTACV